jgi:hypothetical protein
MKAPQFIGERRQHLAVITIFTLHRTTRQPHLKPTPVKPLDHLCSEPTVLNVFLIRVGITDGRPEHPQKEWAMVTAENLVVAIA